MSVTNLGFIGEVVNTISNAFSGIANWINDKIGDQIDAMITIILKFVYEILKVFFMLLDFIQLVFRKMAGLDTVYLQDGTAHSGDLAILLFQNENVVNALIALMVTAVVLVFMATFVAIIRNHYTAKEAKDTAVGPVIGKAFKAIFSFIFVPIVCYFGVVVSNGLLKTVDQATRMSGALTISGEVFVASAMNANRARIDENFVTQLGEHAKIQADDEGIIKSINPNGIFSADNTTQYLTSKTSGDKIDEAFASKQEAPTGTSVIASSDDFNYMYRQDSPGKINNFDYMNTNLVFVYYDLFKFNWLFAFVSCFFIMATLLVSAMGVIQRLFEITILFAISPPFIALMPLDNGKAFGNWAKRFITSTLIMYGTVVALNFFFIIAPILQNINLFGSPAEIEAYGKLTCDLFNAIAHILFIMCGSLVIKDFTDLINQLVTGDKVSSLQDRGANVAKEVQGNMAKGLQSMDATVGRAKRAYNDYYSAENVKKRQEAKAEKQSAKEDRAAQKSATAGMRKAGMINRREEMALNRDLKRKAQGKTNNLISRSDKHMQLMKQAEGGAEKFREELALEQSNNAGKSRLRHAYRTSAFGQRRRAKASSSNDYADKNMTQERKALLKSEDSYNKAKAADLKTAQKMGLSKEEANKRFKSTYVPGIGIVDSAAEAHDIAKQRDKAKVNSVHTTELGEKISTDSNKRKNQKLSKKNKK